MSPIFCYPRAGYVHGFVFDRSKDYAELRVTKKYNINIAGYKITESIKSTLATKL
jgi:hypothetical protein